MKFINNLFNRLTSKQVNWISGTILLLLIIHFALVVFYALPDSLKNNRVAGINEQYMVPLFYQNHKNPSAQQIPFHIEMEGRVFANNQWTEWAKPTPFGTDKNGSLEQSYHRIKKWLHQESISTERGVYFIDGKRMDERLERSVSYYAAHLFTDRYFVNQGIKDADSVQVKLQYETLGTRGITNEKPKEFILNPLKKP